MLLPMRSFILVRHGQSVFNAQGRLQGSLRHPRLTNLGKQQAQECGAALAASPLVNLGPLAFCSPLRRAQETAEEIKIAFESSDKAFPKEVLILNALSEIGLYSWEGRPKVEIEAESPEAYRLWRTDPANFHLGGHFPVRDLWHRARGAWETMLRLTDEVAMRQPTAAVLVVGHYCMLQSLLCTAFSRDESSFWKFPWANGGALEIVWSGVGVEPEARRFYGSACQWRWLYPVTTEFVNAASMSRFEIGLEDALGTI
ncbi:unnamed protein product [Phaeothamnion confervicola]